jgi:hypothetical protein
VGTHLTSVPEAHPTNGRVGEGGGGGKGGSGTKGPHTVGVFPLGRQDSNRYVLIESRSLLAMY